MNNKRKIKALRSRLTPSIHSMVDALRAGNVDGYLWALRFNTAIVNEIERLEGGEQKDKTT